MATTLRISAAQGPSSVPASVDGAFPFADLTDATSANIPVVNTPLANALVLLAPKANPTFTGTVTIPSGASIAGYLTTASAASTYQALPIVTAASPATGATITSAASVDETHYLTPAGTLATLNWALPSAANSRVGQIKMLWSSKDITTLNVTVASGGSLVGSLTAATAEEAYSFQCVSAGVWLRIA
jgi:hypothetical protein